MLVLTSQTSAFIFSHSFCQMMKIALPAGSKNAVWDECWKNNVHWSENIFHTKKKRRHWKTFVKFHQAENIQILLFIYFALILLAFAIDWTEHYMIPNQWTYSLICMHWLSWESWPQLNPHQKIFVWFKLRLIYMEEGCSCLKLYTHLLLLCLHSTQRLFNVLTFIKMAKHDVKARGG